jgi:uncharacterized SAM-binding protein YcdF (DUF218 family)
MQMRIFFGVILGVLLAYLGGFLLFLGGMPTPPSKPHADAIVALTGGHARLDTAVALLEKGAGQRLLISGVDMETEKETLGRMAQGGVRFACCADVGYNADDTHGNAEEAADWARAHRYRSLIIVTARYHMPRAMREFADVMPGMALTPYPVETGNVDMEHWWRHRDTTVLLQREYIKYLGSLAMTAIS